MTTSKKDSLTDLNSHSTATDLSHKDFGENDFSPSW